MGRVRIVGDASRKEYSIKEPSTGEVHIVNETDGVTLAKLTPSTISDASGVVLASHASRHGYGQLDAIPDNYLSFRQVRATLAGATSVSVAAAGTYTIPKGVWYVFLSADTRCEVYNNAAGAWATLIPAGGTGLVISDGSNVRLYNAGTAAETSYLREVY